MKLTEQIQGCQVTCAARRTLNLSFQPGDSCGPRRRWNITSDVGRSKIYQVFRHETLKALEASLKPPKARLKPLKPTPFTQGQGFAVHCTWLQTREEPFMKVHNEMHRINAAFTPWRHCHHCQHEREKAAFQQQRTPVSLEGECFSCR